MKVYIIGKEIEQELSLKDSLLKKGFEISEDPELVIVYGGDGMMLIAERRFPCVPKVLIKGSEISNKGHGLSIDEIVEKYLKKEYNVHEIKKLKAVKKSRFETRELIATNDIVIRNTLPTEAVRFLFKFDKEENLIGDGIVVSTPYGSDAYFYSITRERFDKGVGVAFNNTTIKKEALFFDEGKIYVKILRGPAVLVSDNNRDFVNLEKDDEIEIFPIDETAKIIEIK